MTLVEKVAVMNVETEAKIVSVVNVMVSVVSVNLTIKTTALLMNVGAESVNVNPYLTAPWSKRGFFIVLILVTIVSYLNL